MFPCENRNGLKWITNLGQIVLKVDNQITYHKFTNVQLRMGFVMVVVMVISG